jgi:hypothetical protein
MQPMTVMPPGTAAVAHGGLRAVGGMAVRPAPLLHLFCRGTLGKRGQVIAIRRPAPRHNVIFFPVRPTPCYKIDILLEFFPI